MKQLGLPDHFSSRAHEVAFESWLAMRQASGRVRRDSSAALYRDMWGSFTGWCAGQNPPVSLACLRREDLLAFQASRLGGRALEISPRHALRLLRLIDQVLNYTVATEDARPNTVAREAIEAQPIVRYAEASDNDILPQVLDALAAQELIIFLTGARPRGDAGTDALGNVLGRALTWQSLRNRVGVALQLGAGLTPAEVRALRLDATVTAGSRVPGRPWKLLVAGNGNAPAHEAHLASWAAELLQQWLQLRSAQGIAGDWLFPSKLGGQPWGKVAQYNAARQVLREAGLDSPEGGSFRLRHTFAIRQLRNGTAPDKVARWLGVSDPKVMQRYARVLDRAPDVV